MYRHHEGYACSRYIRFGNSFCVRNYIKEEELLKLIRDDISKMKIDMGYIEKKLNAEFRSHIKDCSNELGEIQKKLKSVEKKNLPAYKMPE